MTTVSWDEGSESRWQKHTLSPSPCQMTRGSGVSSSSSEEVRRGFCRGIMLACSRGRAEIIKSTFASLVMMNAVKLDVVGGQEAGSCRRQKR